jgi:hypothetical protein
MPVGTYGTVKGMTPEEVEATGAQIILGNHFPPVAAPGAGNHEMRTAICTILCSGKGRSSPIPAASRCSAWAISEDNRTRRAFP